MLKKQSRQLVANKASNAIHEKVLYKKDGIHDAFTMTQMQQVNNANAPRVTFSFCKMVTRL